MNLLFWVWADHVWIFLIHNWIPTDLSTSVWILAELKICFLNPARSNAEACQTISEWFSHRFRKIQNIVICWTLAEHCLKSSAIDSEIFRWSYFWILAECVWNIQILSQKNSEHSYLLNLGRTLSEKFSHRFRNIQMKLFLNLCWMCLKYSDLKSEKFRNS